MVILGGLEIVAAGYIIHKHNKNKKERQRIEEEEEHIYATQEKDRHRRRRSRSRDRHDGKSGRRYHSADDRRDERYRPVKPILVQNPGMPTVPHQNMQGPPPYAQAVGQPPAGPSHLHRNQAQPQTAYPQDIKYGWTPEPTPAQQPPAQDPSYPPTGWPAHWPQSQSPEPNARNNGRERSEARVRLAVPGEAAITQPGEEGNRKGRGRERRRARSDSGSLSPPRYRS